MAATAKGRMTEGGQLSAPQDPVTELTENISEAARALFSAGSVTGTLQRVVDVAKGTIDGCDFAGVFILEGVKIYTPAYTDPVVVDIDAFQHETGEGPCLDAISAGGSVYADEFIDNSRWPHFGPEPW